MPVPKQVLPQLVGNSSSTAITLHPSGKINMKTHSTQQRTSLHQRLRYSTTIPPLPSCYLLGLGHGTYTERFNSNKLKTETVIGHFAFVFKERSHDYRDVSVFEKLQFQNVFGSALTRETGCVFNLQKKKGFRDLTRAPLK